jgi:hypothetical protein
VNRVRIWYAVGSLLFVLAGVAETLVPRWDIIPPPLEPVAIIGMGPLGWLYFWGASRFLAWQLLVPYIACTVAANFALSWASKGGVLMWGLVGIIWGMTGMALLMLLKT